MIDALVEAAGAFSSPLSALLFFYMHGAATRVPVAETAFAARRPQWDFDAIGQWTDGARSAEHIAWVRALWSRATTGQKELLEGIQKDATRPDIWTIF